MDENSRKQGTSPSTPYLTAGERRRLAVLADCHPATILRVLQGQPVRTIASERARAVLVREGYLPVGGAGVAA